MRFVFPGLVAAFAALSLSAAPFTHVAQSSVTLTTTYSRTGDFAQTEAKRSDDDYLVTFGVSTVRFGNAELLDVLVFNKFIPEKKGWTVVAVWADWENNGASSYRFFVRKKITGGYDTRAIPSDLLAFELLDPYVAKTVRSQDDEIISGTDRYKAYSRLTLGKDPREPSDTTDAAKRKATRRTSGSAALGMISGSGRYVRPKGAAASFYLPGAASYVGYANSTPYVDVTNPVNTTEVRDVVVANLRLASSTAIPSTQYPAFTGEKPGLGPDSTAIVEP
jgi:hypothetical protein